MRALFVSYDSEKVKYLGRKYDSIVDIYRNYLPDYKISTKHWNEFFIDSKGDYNFGSFKLKEFDFIFFGFISNNTSIAKIIIDYVKENRIPHLVYGNYNFIDNKIHELNILRSTSGLNFNIIPTVATSRITNRILSEISKNLTFPIIMKPFNGSRGDGIIKFDSIESIEGYDIDSPHLFQSFIDNNGDYRIFVVKNKVKLVTKRVRNDSKEFRNNYCIGSSEIVSSSISEIIKNNLEELSKKLNFDVVGFDIFIDDLDKDKFWVIEMNSAPSYIAFCNAVEYDLIQDICKEIKMSIPKELA